MVCPAAEMHFITTSHILETFNILGVIKENFKLKNEEIIINGALEKHV